MHGADSNLGPLRMLLGKLVMQLQGAPIRPAAAQRHYCLHNFRTSLLGASQRSSAALLYPGNATLPIAFDPAMPSLPADAELSAELAPRLLAPARQHHKPDSFLLHIPCLPSHPSPPAFR